MIKVGTLRLKHMRFVLLAGLLSANVAWADDEAALELLESMSRAGDTLEYSGEFVYVSDGRISRSCGPLVNPEIRSQSVSIRVKTPDIDDVIVAASVVPPCNDEVIIQVRGDGRLNCFHSALVHREIRAKSISI